ncbi:MAG: hypothetical protein R3E82_23265 [Pseudomonadales bacterium]
MRTEWHSEETYKGLIQLSQTGLKFGALVNGGASIALLALIGDVVGRGVSVPSLKVPMVLFIVGIALSGFAHVTAYVTQLRLYNESALGAKESGLGHHVIWLWISLFLVVCSIVLFMIGAYCGTTILTGIQSDA